MKKKGFILAAIFIVFLCIGVWFNMQRGLYLQDTFWKLGPDGAYVSPRGDTIRYSETDGYHLNFNGNMLTVQVENHADGSYRFDFSDGIAMETADESSMLLQIGGVVLAGEMDYIVTDVNSNHFHFVRASETIHEPFYDESGKKIGKNVSLVADTGEIINFSEIWYGHPEYSDSARETITIHNGTRLSYEDLHTKLFQNAAGEYLLDANRLTQIETSDGYIDRGYMVSFMLSIAEKKVEYRGSAAAIALSCCVYLIGAASFLLPEHAAFFGSRWRFKNEPELSDEGLMAVQAGNIIVMLLAIAALFIPFL